MKLLLILSMLLGTCCMAQKQFDIEGHRGARGLYPENTITAFIEAVKLGVNTLEMDAVVSKDGQLVVSHEPFMNAEICRDAAGRELQNPKEKYNIYQLTYDEIKQIDCGSWGNSKFPEQKKTAGHKPLLSEVIDTVEKFIAANHLHPVQYNIETKCTPEGDGKFHPAPKEFSALLYNLLKQKNILQRSIIQSFDIRTLQAVRQMDSTVTTALLVFNADGFEKNIARLGFTPAIYSPNFILVNKKLIKACHAAGILIIPWTINDEKEMRKVKMAGADGLISDYPDRAIKLLR